jgi:hypothetical protein
MSQAPSRHALARDPVRAHAVGAAATAPPVAGSGAVCGDELPSDGLFNDEVERSFIACLYIKSWRNAHTALENHPRPTILAARDPTGIFG